MRLGEAWASPGVEERLGEGKREEERRSKKEMEVVEELCLRDLRRRARELEVEEESESDSDGECESESENARREV